LLAGGENADGDGEVEAGALLFHVGGGEVDDGPGLGKLEGGVAEGGGHPVARLFDRRVRQADDHDDGIPPAGIDLDLDGEGLDAANRR
jgi:hypothetical protein